MLLLQTYRIFRTCFTWPNKTHHVRMFYDRALSTKDNLNILPRRQRLAGVRIGVRTTMLETVGIRTLAHTPAHAHTEWPLSPSPSALLLLLLLLSYTRRQRNASSVRFRACAITASANSIIPFARAPARTADNVRARRHRYHRGRLACWQRNGCRGHCGIMRRGGDGRAGVFATVCHRR